MSTMAKQGMSGYVHQWEKPPLIHRIPRFQRKLFCGRSCGAGTSHLDGPTTKQVGVYPSREGPDTIVQPGKNVWDNFVSTSRAQKTPTKVKTLGRNHQENPAPTTRWRHSLVCEFHKTRKCTKPRPLIVKTQGNNVRHPKTCLVHHAVVTKTDLSHQRKNVQPAVRVLRANVQGRTALPPECTPAQCGPRSL